MVSSSKPGMEEEEEEEAEETQVERRDSLDDADERNETEKQLCKHIKENEKKEIKKIISTHRNDIDVNRKDLEDHDILTLAVMTKDVETVNMILDIHPDQVDIKPGLLEAAKQGSVKMVLAFFFFADKQKVDGHKWQAIVAGAQQMQGKKPKVVTSDSIVKGEFTPDQTPLMMAASGGHYDVIKLFYDRGERLPPLHFPSCACSVCKTESRDLERTLNRLHVLRAMTNPQYLIFMGEQDGDLDPVLESFDRIKDIKQCSKEEPEFKEEYEKILEKIKKFPVDLINLCRTTEEAKIFLGQREGYVGPPSMQYPRLGLAIEHSHKEFVTAPNIQFFMHNEWVGYRWNPKDSTGEALKFICTLLLIVGFPFFQLILWFGLCCCCNQTGLIKYLMSPINRCWGKFGSYCFFIVLLIYMTSEERPEADLEPPTIYVRWVLLVYVASHLVSLIQQFLINPKGFLSRGWNKVDLFIQVTYWMTFCLWGCFFIRKSYLGSEETISRRRLDCLDTVLIGEIFFAVASTAATLRLLRWYIIPKHTGPIQSVFNRLGHNYKLLLVVFTMSCVSFSVSSKILFRPYIQNKEDKELSVWEQLKKSSATIFGTDELDPDKLKLETPSDNYTTADGVERVTENPPKTNLLFIKLMSVIYYVVGVGFIQNYATGSFASDSETYLEGKEIDWKYLRLQEWLYHMQDTILAPPFNLIPNAGCFKSVCSWFSTLARGGKGKREAGCSFHQCCFFTDLESGQVEDAKKKYPFLLKTLFQRYLQMTMTEAEDEKPIKSNVSSIMEAVKELRGLSKEVLGISESGAENMSTQSLQVPSSSKSKFEKRSFMETVFSTDTNTTANASSMMPPPTARTTTATAKPDPSVQFVKSPKS